MQGLKLQQTTQKEDKSKAIANIMQSATQMLKNGVTLDVVDFALATLTEITFMVLLAIINASFTMLESALQQLEDGNTVSELRLHRRVHLATADDRSREPPSVWRMPTVPHGSSVITL